MAGVRRHQPVERLEPRGTSKSGGRRHRLPPDVIDRSAFPAVDGALRNSTDLVELEARRVARLLHDSAGQIVFALQLALADLDRDLPQSLRPRLQDASQLLQQLDRQLHCHARELYPVVLEELGVAAALRDFIESIRHRAGLRIVFTCSVADRLPRNVEAVVYRAVQEALRNIVKHARATEVTVTLDRVGPMLACSIVDDGVGFLPRPFGQPGPGLGLVGLRDRMLSVAGTVLIRSKLGHGTQVLLGVPLPAGQETQWG